MHFQATSCNFFLLLLLLTIRAPACRWLSSSKCQHLVADKAYPPLLRQQEERATTYILHVLTAGCYQAVAATAGQWLNLCSRDEWDTVVIIMLFNFYIYFVVYLSGSCFVSESVDSVLPHQYFIVSDILSLFRHLTTVGKYGLQYDKE